jgi:hypothetical protein
MLADFKRNQYALGFWWVDYFIRTDEAKLEVDALSVLEGDDAYTLVKQTSIHE